MAAIADPNVAFLLLIAGVVGLLWEWQAPGGLVPGMLGILCLAAALFSFGQDRLTWYGISLLAAALLLFAAELKFGGHGVSGVAGAVLLGLGAIALVSGPHPIQPALAIAASCSAGAIAIFLGYLGWRARRSPPLTGIDNILGARGVARTDIGEQGTIFVRGEYWLAESALPIPAGKSVLVEAIHGLVLRVREG